MPSAAKTFVANVKNRMGELEITGVELARKLKITPTAVYYVLSGKERVTLDRAERIASALETPLASLLIEPKKFEKVS